MADAPRRQFGRTLGSLALALVNATLILLALCLWLGWQVVSEARAVTAQLAERAGLLQPLQTELLGLRSEVAGLRSDLAAWRAEGDASAALTGLADQLEGVDARLSAATDQVDALLDDPGLLVDRAVDRAALQIKSGIAACTVAGG
jgi:hypothetical protein